MGTEGNKSFYGSELFRKVFQTSRGKDFTETSVLQGRPEVIRNLHSHTLQATNGKQRLSVFFPFLSFYLNSVQHPELLHPSYFFNALFSSKE